MSQRNRKLEKEVKASEATKLLVICVDREMILERKPELKHQLLEEMHVSKQLKD